MPDPAVPPAAPPAAAPADPAMTLEELRAAQRKEYSQYVAVSAIEHAGVRAYNPGDPVPASNVDKHGYLDAGLVAKAGTKAAKAATGQEI